MNLTFKAGGAMALATTIITIIARLWADAPSFIAFISQNSSFFYGLAAGIVVAGISKNFWVILLAIAGVFILLKWVGL